MLKYAVSPVKVSVWKAKKSLTPRHKMKIPTRIQYSRFMHTGGKVLYIRFFPGLMGKNI